MHAIVEIHYKRKNEFLKHLFLSFDDKFKLIKIKINRNPYKCNQLYILNIIK